MKSEKSSKQNMPDYQKIVEGSLAAHAVVNENIILFCNTAFEALTGYPRQDLCGMAGAAFPALFRDDQLELVQHLVRLCREGGQISYHPEVRLSKKDGSLCWIEVNFTPLIFRDQNAIHLSCIDRTERKRLADASYDAARIHRNLLSNDKLLIVMFDLHGYVSFCNQSMLDCIGWQHHEITGRNWFDTCVSDQNIKRHYLEVMERQTVPMHNEYDIVTATGERRTLFLSCTLMHDSQGSAVGVMGVGEDLTERRRTEMALRENQEKFASIVEYTRDGILLCDEEGTVIAWNHGLELITGMKREQVLGKPLWETLFALTSGEYRSPEIYRNIKQFHENLLTTGVLKSHSVDKSDIQTVDGVRKTVELEFFIIHTSRGHRIGTIMSDTSKMTALADALQKTEEHCRGISASVLRERQMFLSSLSARLRSPVNHISGLSTLLLSTTTLTKKQRECASAIQASVESLLRIIEEASVFPRSDRAPQ